MKIQTPQLSVQRCAADPERLSRRRNISRASRQRLLVGYPFGLSANMAFGQSMRLPSRVNSLPLTRQPHQTNKKSFAVSEFAKLWRVG
jgi:hypothetical protein